VPVWYRKSYFITSSVFLQAGFYSLESEGATQKYHLFATKKLKTAVETVNVSYHPHCRRPLNLTVIKLPLKLLRLGNFTSGFHEVLLEHVVSVFPNRKETSLRADVPEVCSIEAVS